MLALGAAVLLAVILLALWLLSGTRSATVASVALRSPHGSGGPGAGKRMADPVVGARAPVKPPRLLAPAGVRDPGAPVFQAMSEGLSQDLEMFDGTQLRSELESIALSYADVRVLDARCSARPCEARAASRNVDEMEQFVRMVSLRFQGHVFAEFHRRPPAVMGN